MRPGPAVVALGALVAVVVVAAISGLGGPAPWMAVALFAVVDAVLLVVSAGAGRGAKDSAWAPRRFVTLLGACWLAVTVVPAHDFSGRAPEAAATSVSVQALAEVMLFGAVGLAALFVLHVLPEASAGALRRLPAPLVLVPVWIVASSVWATGTGPYAFARGIEIGTLAVLAWATIAIGRSSAACLDELVGSVLRWLVCSVAVLAVLGIVFGARFTPIALSNRDRFTWPGAHPNSAGALVAVAILVLVTLPSRSLRLAPVVRVALVAGFLAALFENHSRTALAALLGAFVLALWAGGRRRPGLRAVGIPYLAGGVALATVVAWSSIYRYVLRGGSSERLHTLNNRTQLWDVGTGALHGPLDWMLGLGYGAARVVFRPSAAFAGEAHNSALSLLVSLGLVGLALFVALLLGGAWRVWRGDLVGRTGFGLSLLVVVGFVVVHAATSDVLAEPGLGLGLVFLLAAATVPEPSPAPCEGEFSSLDVPA